MDAVKIVIFDEEELTRTLAESYLKDLVFPYRLEKYKEFNEIQSDNEEKFVILNINNYDDETLKKMSASSDCNHFITVSYDDSTDLRVKAFRNGASDFLVKPLVKSDFLYVMNSLFKKYSAKNNNEITAICSVITDNNEEDKNILLFNLISEVQKLTEEKILLLDFDYSNYILPSLLKIQTNTCSSSEIDGYITKCDEKNLFYLCLKSDDEKLVQDVFELVKNKYKYIFLNLNISMNEDIKRRFISFCSSVFCILNDKSNIKKIRNLTETTEETGKIKYIFNKYDVKSKDKVESFQKILGEEITSLISKNITALEQVVLYRKPVNDINRNLEISKDYVNLANEIVDRMRK